MDLISFCCNISRNLLFVWENFLNEWSRTQNVHNSSNFTNHHNCFLWQPRVVSWEERETYNFFIICFWTSISVYQFLFIIYISKQGYESSTRIWWIMVMFILGVSEFALARRTYPTAFWGGVAHYNVHNSDYRVVDFYTPISSLPFHVPSSCTLAIPEKTDFADKARQRRTFTAPFSFCWIFFFIGRKEKYSANVISDICIR